MHLYQATLAPGTKEVLETVKDLSGIGNFYLSGGTALALHLGHRESEDLDFFTKQEFDPLSLQDELVKHGELEDVGVDKGTLNLFFNGVKLQFLHYPYNLLEPPVVWKDIKLSSVVDIACTKLITVSARGSKKDFIDMYVILQQFTLEQLFEKMESKYENIGYNIPSILKSLVYFEDAQGQPMPKMHTALEWGEVKSFLTCQVKKISF